MGRCCTVRSGPVRSVLIRSRAERLNKVSEELYSMLRQDFGNLSLWNRYIQLTQSTVSRCSAQKVMALYAKAMEKINFMQKHGILMTELHLIGTSRLGHRTRESDDETETTLVRSCSVILISIMCVRFFCPAALFTRCALFLRQAGLWEQLCMLIRLNLQLNLSDSGSDHYKVDVRIREDSVREYNMYTSYFLLTHHYYYVWLHHAVVVLAAEQLEDEILECGLPIDSLWLRIEKLRERVHWYPIADAECDDPQRVIVPTDVTDLIRPITTQSLSLRIAIQTMHLLKVPLIPLRDGVFRILGFGEIPSYLDSSEVLLSAFGSTSITQGTT